MSDQDADEAIGYVSSNEPSIWRPLLYIIPLSGITEDRVTIVPHDKRAGSGPEYVIEDLAGSEFERISF